MKKAFDPKTETRTVKTSIVKSGSQVMTTVSESQKTIMSSENIVVKQSRFKKPQQSTSFFEQTYAKDAGLEFGQIGEENGKPVYLSTVVQPVLVTTEYEISKKSPTQTFDAFE